MVQVQKREDLSPICPHCDKQLKTVYMRELEGTFLGKRFIYYCEHCKKVLGISHRKGFWMG